MNLLNLPWLELAIASTLLGCPIVSQVRNLARAYRLSLAFIGAAFGCTVLAWLAFYVGVPPVDQARFSLQRILFGRQIFALDELNAPIVPTIALLHLLIALATSRKSKRRYSFSWSMAVETVGMAKFSCTEPWILIGLLATSTAPPYVELLNRSRSHTCVRRAHGPLRGVLGPGLVGGDTRRRKRSSAPLVGNRLAGCWHPRAMRHRSRALLGD